MVKKYGLCSVIQGIYSMTIKNLVNNINIEAYGENFKII